MTDWMGERGAVALDTFFQNIPWEAQEGGCWRSGQSVGQELAGAQSSEGCYQQRRV